MRNIPVNARYGNLLGMNQNTPNNSRKHKKAADGRHQRARRAARHSSKTRQKVVLTTVSICALALCVMLAAVLSIGIRRPGSTTRQTANASSELDSSRASNPPASFTFVGVGDNFLQDAIFVYHEMMTGNRDYLPIFENTLPYTQNADLSYINMETVCGGDDYGLSGDPAYNGPLEMINTLQAAGFDWLSLASDHSLDLGDDPLKNEINYTNTTFPDIATTGAFQSLADAEKPVVRDVNGIRVGLISFTSNLGTGIRPNGEDWLVDLYRNADGSVNYDLMKKRIEAAKDESDVQIVSLQWGDEFSTEVNQEQRTIAKFLSEQGVDVIIGTNPHVIQPVEFIHNGDRDTLVYYSLGTFLSALDNQESMVGGMASFTLHYNFYNGKVSFDNVKFIPTIVYMSPDLMTFRTTTISEYTDEMAANQYIAQFGLDTSRGWVNEFVRSVLGSPKGVEVVTG